jgi:hypothetical protein
VSVTRSGPWRPRSTIAPVERNHADRRERRPIVCTGNGRPNPTTTTAAATTAIATIAAAREWWLSSQICWVSAQAVTFLQHCARISDPLAELYELIICTGMRKGEALALHWADVDLDDRLLFVRYTLSNVNNTTPVFTAPETSAWPTARATRTRTWSSPDATANRYDTSTCCATSAS